MPGILPMKVIKVGSNSQSRIAQACDRCRSKKIRCDGIRPCCSQCANVGFECKTSDKLSRRAFPRGYTESLEERVRSLEGEVRELKDLLDEKDEKIDMLSKMHSNRRPSTSSVSSPPLENKDVVQSPPKEDIFRVQASPLLVGAEKSDSYFMGASSGRAFIDAFKRKIQENGKSLAGFNTEAFLTIQIDKKPPSLEQHLQASTAPPRMFSDRCVNIFFQEWAPLFPVLHKPTFLHLYEEYMSNSEEIIDPHKLAQLHLVFAIAGYSSDIPDRDSIAFCENQWRLSLDTLLMDNSLSTLQCLILASIYCISKADYNRLQHYKGIAVGLSHRLGLHQSQKRFSFGALTSETRKKVFWSLYTLDCFSAALLGLPKLLREEDIHTEYPSDTDDEYVTEKGFQPTLPGEYTKISNALALFRVSRVLSKILEQIYPSAATHDISLHTLESLEIELNDWSEKLPQHLKLTFVQDKPSTDVTGSRSALLSLAYYYIRSLIHRPAVGSSLGHKSSPSVISLADSSKHIIQIVQLLEERRMSFSFCLNKNAMLTLCGLSLLYQGMDLKQEGKLMQDIQRLVVAVICYLEKSNAPGGSNFKKLAASMVNIESQFRGRQSSETSMATKSKPSPSVSQKQLQPQLYRYSNTSMSECDNLTQQENLRRATLPNVAVHSQGSRIYGRSSVDLIHPDSPMLKRDGGDIAPHLPTMVKSHSNTKSKAPNLDYLSLNNTPATSQPQSPIQSRPSHSKQIANNQTTTQPTYNTSKNLTTTPTEWEVLLGSYDDRHLYDAIYGGGPASTAVALTDTGSSNYGAWSPESWDYATIGLDDFTNNAAPQSVLSFSEESLSSSEDLTSSDLGIQGIHNHKIDLSGALLSTTDGYGFLLDNFEGGFNL